MQVFLSYSQRDREDAESIASALTEQGFDVWDPVERVMPGENVSLEIGKALEASDALIVLLSPEALASHWIKGEIEYALSSRRFEGRLIPVVVRPTPDIPWILKKLSVLRLKSARETGPIVDALNRIRAA